MAKVHIRDEWLLPTLETLLSKESTGILKSAAQESYWEAAVRRGFISDDEILTALASRFHMKIANLALATPQAREHVPEPLARKYRILPLTISDSALEIATADPHDLDCERTLAFATGRTVKMSLAAPTKIAERLDELYRPENVVVEDPRERQRELRHPVDRRRPGARGHGALRREGVVGAADHPARRPHRRRRHHVSRE